MNQSDDNPTTTLAASTAEVAQEADAKPVRRRRTRKTEAALTELPAPAAPVVAAAEVHAGEGAPKLARKPRPVVPKTDEPAATELPAASLELCPAAPAPSSLPLPSAAEAPDGPGEQFSAAGHQDQGSEAAPSAQPFEEGGDAPRSRNRRRSRKERPRGEPVASDQVSVAVPFVPGEGAVTVGPQVVAQAGEVFAQVLSGDFDVEDPASSAGQALAEGSSSEQPGGEGGDPAAQSAQGDANAGALTHRRVLQPEPDAPKLHKVLAQAGVGSRRDMEELILDGQITVNGEPAHIGQRISFGDQIKVKGQPVRVRIVPPPPRILAYHKPVGEVVTHDDPEHRPTVFRRLPRLQQGKWQSVGRLDLNTEGLLLFTNSGELANQLMHPRFAVEREYAVRVLGSLTAELQAQLRAGVDIDGQMANFQSIEDGGGEGANHWYRVIITEGRNREVRKLFDAVGLTVSRLIRIRYGTVVLPRGLKRGVWVDLSETDVRIIRQMAGHTDRASRQEGRGNAPQDRGAQSRNPHERGARNNPRNQQGQAGGSFQSRGPRARGLPPPNAASTPRPPRDSSHKDGDHDEDLDFDPAKIPNPLEQTFDKRFVQRPRGPAGGTGFGRGGGGFGAGGSAPQRPQGGQKKGGGPREPDPLQTSMGYLGADAYHGRKGNGGGGRGGNRGGGGGGFGGGFGGGRRGR